MTRPSNFVDGVILSAEGLNPAFDAKADLDPATGLVLASQLPVLPPAPYSRPAGSAFTQRNFGGGTGAVLTDNANGPLTLITNPTNWETTQLVYCDQPIANPASWRVQAEIGIGGPFVAGGSQGLYATDSIGRITSLCMDLSNGVPTIFMTNWTNYSTYYATSASLPVSPGSSIWLAMEVSAGNLTAYYSFNGVDWIPLVTVSATNFATSGYSYVGFGADTYIGLSNVAAQGQPRATSLNKWAFVAPV